MIERIGQEHGTNILFVAIGSPHLIRVEAVYGGDSAAHSPRLLSGDVAHQAGRVCTRQGYAQSHCILVICADKERPGVDEDPAIECGP